MFKRLAKFRRLELRHLVPHWLEAAHSNDNPRGRRRPTGQRRSPQPVLACHWVFIDESRLECRWMVESFDETSVEQPDGHPGRVISLNPVRCVARTSLGDAIQQHPLRSLL